MSSVFSCRVYYSDTDCEGIAYHGRYLDWAEHAPFEKRRQILGQRHIVGDRPDEHRGEGGGEDVDNIRNAVAHTDASLSGFSAPSNVAVSMAVYGLSIYAYEYVVLSMKSSNGDFVVGSVSLRHSSPYGEIHSKMKKYSEYLCIIHK